MGEEEGKKRKEKVTKGGKKVLVKLVEQLLQCMVDLPSLCLSAYTGSPHVTKVE